MDTFFTANEASEYLKKHGISLEPLTLRRKAQKGRITVHRDGAKGRPMFSLSALEKYIESLKKPASYWPRRG